MSLSEPTPQQYPEPAPPVRAVHIHGELVLPLDHGLALVASKSEVDVWHVVEHGRCTCKAFQYRETCRHLAIAAAARSFVPCYRCGAPTPATGDGTFPTCGKCAKALLTLDDADDSDARARALFAKLDARHRTHD